jgi:riboflavin kinase/FMN adenylyltransferase
VVALGFFDGVHIGHRSLIKRALLEARARGAIFTVFTFVSESSEIKSGAERLYSTENKLSILSELGADETVLADFESIRDRSAEDFARGILVGELNTVLAVTGKDFRFGRGALGDSEQLSRLLGLSGRDALTLDDVTLRGEKVSSSRIREALKTDIGLANELLGSPYFIDARVESGRGVGRALGFPTVNVPLSDAARELRRGVYASRIVIDSVEYTALSNVGVCPTFGEREGHLEGYIFNFNGDLYGKRVRVYLDRFIRDEIRFNSEKELISQIKLDINSLKKEFL